jgi:hypothetical protein
MKHESLKSMFRTVQCIVLASLIVACVSRASAVGLQAGDVELATKIDSLLSAAVRDGFGGAVIVEREGGILLSKGFGRRHDRTDRLDHEELHRSCIGAAGSRRQSRSTGVPKVLSNECRGTRRWSRPLRNAAAQRQTVRQT